MSNILPSISVHPNANVSLESYFCINVKANYLFQMIYSFEIEKIYDMSSYSIISANFIYRVLWPQFYQTRSAWSKDQGSNENHSPVHNFAPTVTKFCVMSEGQALVRESYSPFQASFAFAHRSRDRLNAILQTTLLVIFLCMKTNISWVPFKFTMFN